jgi:hypothetical protein
MINPTERTANGSDSIRPRRLRSFAHHHAAKLRLKDSAVYQGLCDLHAQFPVKYRFERQLREYHGLCDLHGQLKQYPFLSKEIGEDHSLCDLHRLIEHSDAAFGTFLQVQHCGEHNRDSAGDTVSCTQPWFHRLPFAAGKYPESNPDGALATFYRIHVSAFGGIPGGRRLSAVLCGEDRECIDGDNKDTSSASA